MKNVCMYVCLGIAYLLLLLIIVAKIWSISFVRDMMEEVPYVTKVEYRMTIQKHKDFESYETIPATRHPVIMPIRNKGIHLKDGAVPTAATACIIAEAVWHARYGYEYYRYAIKTVALIKDEYWLVRARCGFRVLTIEIRKSDGKILRNFFEK